MKTVRKQIKDLRPGDLLDLEGDVFADRNHESLYFECEYASVGELETETPECIRIDFDHGDSIGFPPDHVVKVVYPFD